MNTFYMKIVSPNEMFFEDEIEEVMLGGSEGYFTILANHTPFVSRLFNSSGYFKKNGEMKFFSISSGFCTVEDNVVTVITRNFKYENFKAVQESFDKTVEFGKKDKEEISEYFNES